MKNWNEFEGQGTNVKKNLPPEFDKTMSEI
jgi:hypothetical protein